ncbi:hypothetical protein [Crenobacter luteus]|uniref:DUF2846 domain-containing protein n=1 Tax=Crenobacter luteus TaxID=1452487 RepID=A0A165G5D2_9NEIS|nr:hypothetical protein [Crenobacter luteus]KZE35149.1 hypothetical protein AVW16_05090 [Crenobacter luteus]
MWLRTTLLALPFLTGCASMASKLDGRLDPPAGQGYAVVSLTALAFEPDATRAQVTYRGANGVQGSVYTSLNTDTVFGPEGTSPVEGRLTLLTLPPGRYRFVEAFGSTVDDPDGGFPFGGSSARSVRLPIGRDFCVAAGETVYLGEIRVDISYRPELILKNSQARDFGHMARVWKVGADDLNRVRVSPLADGGGC